MSKERAIEKCAVGRSGRASGVNMDIRRDDPYGAYRTRVSRSSPPTNATSTASARQGFSEIVESCQGCQADPREPTEGEIASRR